MSNQCAIEVMVVVDAFKPFEVMKSLNKNIYILYQELFFYGNSYYTSAMMSLI